MRSALKSQVDSQGRVKIRLRRRRSRTRGHVRSRSVVSTKGESDQGRPAAWGNLATTNRRAPLGLWRAGGGVLYLLLFFLSFSAISPRSLARSSRVAFFLLLLGLVRVSVRRVAFSRFRVSRLAVSSRGSKIRKSWRGLGIVRRAAAKKRDQSVWESFPARLASIEETFHTFFVPGPAKCANGDESCRQDAGKQGYS